jgi:hypothetical protein
VQLLEPAAHERVELLEADAAAAVHVNLSHQPCGIRLRQVELLQYLLERGGRDGAAAAVVLAEDVPQAGAQLVLAELRRPAHDCHCAAIGAA